MDKRFTGFAVIIVVGFAACHNIFNKDKAARPSTDPVAVAETKTVPVTTDPAGAPAKDSNLRYVYLTFDDGPDGGTLNCYDICKSKGAKATFFLIGEHARDRRPILDTMRKDMRHFLFANHSFSHADNRYESFYSQHRKAFDDFMRVHDSLRFDHPIARFPGNNVWAINGKTRTTRLTRPLARMMDSIGYNVMGWDVEWHFNSKGLPVQSAELMAQQVTDAFETNTSMVKNHVVILTHDRMFREPNYKDSLAKMITILQSRKGYVFETADQYPAIKQRVNALVASRK